VQSECRQKSAARTEACHAHLKWHAWSCSTRYDPQRSTCRRRSRAGLYGPVREPGNFFENGLLRRFCNTVLAIFGVLGLEISLVFARRLFVTLAAQPNLFRTYLIGVEHAPCVERAVCPKSGRSARSFHLHSELRVRLLYMPHGNRQGVVVGPAATSFDCNHTDSIQYSTFHPTSVKVL